MSVVLAVNCGSSSLKFGLYEITASTIGNLCQGEAEEIGSRNGKFTLNGNSEAADFAGHAAALTHALAAMRSQQLPVPDAIGHRFVHGGPHLLEHQPLTPAVLDEIERAVPFAPLHLPSAIQAAEQTAREMPNLPQVACFDTAFHRTLPDVARLFPLPQSIAAQGVHRYGFHGLSLESILSQLHPLPQRLIVAHLGNGASITAIRSGYSIDTTMGLTPTGGIMMGTRTGDLDPGVLLFLLRSGNYDADQLEHLVNHQSGFLGVSGSTSDVRTLLAQQESDPRARLALDMFCYQTAKAIAAMAAALNGVDRLVFTGGIGENAAPLRTAILAHLTFAALGAKATVLPSQEDQQIARITASLGQ